MFYAIVDNDKPLVCELMEDSVKVFKKFDFNITTVQSLGVYQEYDKLCDDIEREFRLVAS